MNLHSPYDACSVHVQALDLVDVAVDELLAHVRDADVEVQVEVRAARSVVAASIVERSGASLLLRL